MNHEKITTVYRFFSVQDQLLYIGKSFRLPARLRQHGRKQPWWLEVNKVTFDHFPTEEQALEAEKRAIAEENPAYNIIFNTGKAQRRTKPPTVSSKKNEEKTFDKRVTDEANTSYPTFFWHDRFDPEQQFKGNLWLEPTLNGLSVIENLLDDLGGYDGFEMVDFYINWLKQNEQFNDELKIYWAVLGADKRYRAPFQIADEINGDASFKMTFLEYFSYPETIDGSEVSWFSLPVHTSRNYQLFWETLAWRPSPLQDTCRFKSIVLDLGF